jgi:hypothetical protein
LRCGKNIGHYVPKFRCSLPPQRRGANYRLRRLFVHEWHCMAGRG